LKTSNEVENKFRFVILAAKRAKQLLRGEKPRLKSKSRNPIRIAQLEVAKGLVHYEIIEPQKEKVSKQEEEGFIGEEIRDSEETPAKEDKKKAKKKVAKPKEKPKEEPEEKPKDKAEKSPKKRAKKSPEKGSKKQKKKG
jgi:DNA-directed RNA polymerase omega subunit